MLRKKNMKSSSRKNIILSIIAVLEVIAIMIVAGYAWVETISAIKIYGSGEFDDALYTNVNIGTGNGYESSVDLADFFRRSGGIHLASSSSANGRDVYFPITKTTTNATGVNPYRKASVNDKNVNYYNFSFNVTAKTSKCDFFFLSEPVIKIDNVAVPAVDSTATQEQQEAALKIRNAIRIAFTVDGVTNIFSLDNIQENVVASLTGVTASTTVHSFDSYLSGLANTSPLFSIAKNATKTVRVTMWLQDTAQNDAFAGKDISVSNLVIGAGRSLVSFKDYTSKFNASGVQSWKWTTASGKKMFVYDGSKCYPMTLQNDDEWQAMVLTSVLEDNTKTLYFCLCNDSVESIDNQNDSDVLAYWAGSVSDMITAQTNVYRAYGNTSSSGGHNVGRGTWGDVVCITFGSALDMSDPDLASLLTVPASGSEASATHVALKNAGGSVESEMNYYINSDDEGRWRAYMPMSEATSVKFTAGTNTLNAGSRGAASEYFMTSASTGYWAPPATVAVEYAEEFGDDCGTISVSGGVTGSTEVQVTANSQVDLSASAAEGYRFVGWSENSDGTGTLLSGNPQTITAPDAEGSITYYAVFIKQYTVRLQTVTDGLDTNTDGGTVTLGSSTDTDVSAIYDEGEEVTISSSANTGFAADGFFTAATGGEELSSLTFTVEKDVTYYGRFHSVPIASGYYLRGTFSSTNWDDSYPMYYVDHDSSCKYVYSYLNVASSTSYYFKIEHNSTWYSDGGTHTNACGPFDFKSTSEGNATFKVTDPGLYVFIYDTAADAQKLQIIKQSSTYSTAASAPQGSSLLQYSLVFKTATQTKGLWLWNGNGSGTAFKIPADNRFSATSEDYISVYQINTSTYTEPNAIGFDSEYTGSEWGNDWDSHKTTKNLKYKNTINYTDDKVFFKDTDGNNGDNEDWDAFTHIGLTFTEGSRYVTQNSVTQLSVSALSGTLKSGAKYSIYAVKGEDKYYIGGADKTTASTVYWMPTETGTYNLFAAITDKWGVETYRSEPVVINVH